MNKKPNAMSKASPLKSIVAEEIRQRILDGRFAPGERISEKALTAELGLSRTPVREALLQLQSQGLVVVRPQSGTFVFDASVEEIRDICELRGIFETGALRIATEHDLEGLVTALKKLVDEAGLKLLQADFYACEQLDRKFHEHIIESSRNRFLIDAYRLIADRVNVLRHQLHCTRDRAANGLRQHKLIVKLLSERKVSEAAREIAAHLRNVQHILSRQQVPKSRKVVASVLS